ncbi:helix-turn-helix transcriptional regulator [Candidatus Poribacteria bacterium]|nr:helix-turn-helix transcriptional regulator [Candidatus Poribacteria bacterium]
MEKEKMERLASKGWKVGTVREFLELTPEEEAYIELRLALSQSIKSRREEKRLTQKQLAHLLGSNQSRVAKLEAGDGSVSLDLFIRSLLALGTSLQDLAQIIALADSTHQQSA